MFEILKNLPVPEKNVMVNSFKRASKYPFEQMEMGDCMAFPAASIKDPVYKKIYGAAQSYARRVKKGFTFRFGKIDEGKFGCWKIPCDKNTVKENGEVTNTKKVTRRQRMNVKNITKEMLLNALEHEGTLNGASRLLNVSSRTLNRLKHKFEIS